jgi:hypothetical protein
MIRVMGDPAFEPREGGVTIVFDVPQDLVDVAIVHVSAAGFMYFGITPRVGTC